MKRDFSNSDAMLILKIRIPQVQRSDRLMWNASQDGVYTVKSAYHFWQSQTVSFDQVQHSSGWKKLWQLPLPHKVKIFLWRFCKNIIPVQNLLRHRGVNVPILCPLCMQDVEHKLHVFFDCIFAACCWQLVGLQLQMMEEEDAPRWLLRMLEMETTEKFIKIAIVLWGI